MTSGFKAKTNFGETAVSDCFALISFVRWCKFNLSFAKEHIYPLKEHIYPLKEHIYPLKEHSSTISKETLFSKYFLTK